MCFWVNAYSVYFEIVLLIFLEEKTKKQTMNNAYPVQEIILSVYMHTTNNCKIIDELAHCICFLFNSNL